MPPDMEDDNPVSLRDLAAILARRRWQVLIAFAVTLGVVAAGTFLMPKQYQARIKVLVKNERADMIVSPDRNGTAGYRTEVGEAQINSEIELLTGNNLLRQVVVKCGLEKLQRVPGSASAERRAIAVEKAVRRLQRDLKVSPVRKANIIQVEYADTDPRRAAAVLSRLAD